MVYLLKGLISIMLLSLIIIVLTAMGILSFPIGHIQMAIPAFLFTIFVQAFVMFFFIGILKYVEKVQNCLSSPANIEQNFDQPPLDLEPYLKKVKQYHYEATLSKRKVIPWTMLILTLGMFAFLLGGAHDTGLISKRVHVGVVYGFFMATVIGFTRQWYYLGKGHKLLRELKSLFTLPHQSM